NVGNTGKLDLKNALASVGGDMTNDGTLGGRDSMWTIEGTLENNSMIDTEGYMSFSADTIKNNRGASMSGDVLDLFAKKDIINSGGAINAKEGLFLETETGDIINESLIERTGDSRNYAESVSAMGSIGSDGVLSIDSGRDFKNIGGNLTSKGAASISADRDVSFETLELETRRERKWTKKKSWGRSTTYVQRDETVTNVQGDVSFGSDLAISSGRDVTLIGNKMDIAGAGYVSAGRDFNAYDAQDSTYSHREKRKSSAFGKKKTKRKSRNNTSISSELISRESNLSIDAGNNINLVGSKIGSAGVTRLKAKNDINVSAGRNESWTETVVEESGVSASDGNVGMSTETDTTKTNNTTLSASEIYGDGGLVIESGNDINMGGGTQLNSALGDIRLKAENDVNLMAGSNTSSTQHDSSKVGVSTSLSSAKAELSVDNKSDSSERSTLLGTKINAGGNFVVEAGNDVVIDGATEVNTGGDIRLKAGRDVRLLEAFATASSESDETHSSLGLEGSKVTGKMSNDRRTSRSQTSVASAFNAGGGFSAEAGRDIDMAGGVNIDADTIDLTAVRDISIRAGKSTSAQESENMSGSVSYDVASQGVDVALAGGSSKTTSTTYSNSKLNARNGFTLNAGRNTSMSGVDIEAETVDMTVAGDFSFESVQNKSDHNSVQASLQVGKSGAGGSASFANSKRRWVDDQSGITGRSKVNINVGGHTDIKGATIAADNNELTITTETLSVSAIKDIDEKNGFGIGGGKGADGKKQSPHVSAEYFEMEGVTRGTIGAGNIQTKSDTSGINRDLSRAQKTYESVGFNIQVDKVLVDDLKSMKKDVQNLGQTVSDVATSTKEERRSFVSDGISGLKDGVKSAYNTTKEGVTAVGKSTPTALRELGGNNKDTRTVKETVGDLTEAVKTVKQTVEMVHQYSTTINEAQEAVTTTTEAFEEISDGKDLLDTYRKTRSAFDHANTSVDQTEVNIEATEKAIVKVSEQNESENNRLSTQIETDDSNLGDLKSFATGLYEDGRSVKNHFDEGKDKTVQALKDSVGLGAAELVNSRANDGVSLAPKNIGNALNTIDNLVDIADATMKTAESIKTVKASAKNLASTVSSGELSLETYQSASRRLVRLNTNLETSGSKTQDFNKAVKSTQKYNQARHNQRSGEQVTTTKVDSVDRHLIGPTTELRNESWFRVGKEGFKTIGSTFSGVGKINESDNVFDKYRAARSTGKDLNSGTQKTWDVIKKTGLGRKIHSIKKNSKDKQAETKPTIQTNQLQASI
ncbi:hypothetical protein HOH87_01480, partial [bacterium]|nr:hypothetical protein [bacterium]